MDVWVSSLMNTMEGKLYLMDFYLLIGAVMYIVAALSAMSSLWHLLDVFKTNIVHNKLEFESWIMKGQKLLFYVIFDWIV